MGLLLKMKTKKQIKRVKERKIQKIEKCTIKLKSFYSQINYQINIRFGSQKYRKNNKQKQNKIYKLRKKEQNKKKQK